MNLFARKLAIKYLGNNDECFVYLSSCIGKSKLPSAVVKTIKNGLISYQNLNITETPADMIMSLNLNKPVYTDMCRKGLVLF